MINKSTKPSTKEEGVKEEIKPVVKPSVTLDKTKGLDVHVPVTSGNPIDFKFARVNKHTFSSRQ